MTEPKANASPTELPRRPKTLPFLRSFSFHCLRSVILPRGSREAANLGWEPGLPLQGQNPSPPPTGLPVFSPIHPTSLPYRRTLGIPSVVPEINPRLPDLVPHLLCSGPTHPESHASPSSTLLAFPTLSPPPGTLAPPHSFQMHSHNNVPIPQNRPALSTVLRPALLIIACWFVTVCRDAGPHLVGRARQGKGSDRMQDDAEYLFGEYLPPGCWQTVTQSGGEGQGASEGPRAR